MRTCSTGNPAPDPAGTAARPPLARPLGLVLAALGLAWAAQLQLAGRLPLPGCLWRQLWGFPCPSCGMTRSLAAWTHLDPIAALRFHPLCCLACVALLAWTGLALADQLTGRARLATLRARAESWPVWRTLAALALLNWAYLLLALPR